MHATSRPSGFWQSVRQLPERMPLRTKLITAVIVLMAIALAVISVTGITILRNDLLGPYDAQLRAQISHVTNGDIPTYLQERNPQPTPDGTGLAVDWIPNSGGIHQVLQPYSETFSFPRGGFLSPQVPSGNPIPGPAISADSNWINAHLNHPFTVAATNGGGHWRVIMQSAQFQNANGSIVAAGTTVLALDVSGVYTTLGNLAVIDLLVSLAVLALLGLAGVAVIRRSLQPLTDIEKTAGAIAAGDLTRRVPERDPHTEVGRLGRSLNTMLSQIENAFRAQSRSEAAARRSEERMRQFVADASHELRTPLTAIRGFAEYYRQRGGVAGEVADLDEAAIGTADADVVKTALNGTSQLSPADLARIMRRVEQESARMGVLVEDMLLLARLDQQRPLEHTTVDLLALAADAVHDARVVAPNRNINLTVDTGAALLVNGDEVRLRQVVGNLTSNALAHTPDGTPIDVHLRSGNLEEMWATTGTVHTTGYAAEGLASQPVAVLEVTDYGPGLTEEQQVHVFERFYRADQARSAGGTGLGLAIVAALVSAHGGAVWVQSEHGQGAKFSIALPLAPEAIHDDGEDSFPDEDAELLEWGGTRVADDFADSPEAVDRPAGEARPDAANPRERGAGREEVGDPPSADDASSDFHGATAWPGPVSSSIWPSADSDT
jgi:two-component system, OmpR family, sensor kinase